MYKCLLKEMHPFVNIYAKGGNQNELPSFSNKKIIVIRLSVVRSAEQYSFNKENMLTHANNYWPHYKSSRLISNETCTLKHRQLFFSLRNKPTCVYFSCEFLAMLGFQKWVFNAWGAQGCHIFDPWDAQNLLIKFPARCPVAGIDWCKTICDRAHDFVH